jgi:hypothetical protein
MYNWITWKLLLLRRISELHRLTIINFDNYRKTIKMFFVRTMSMKFTPYGVWKNNGKLNGFVNCLRTSKISALPKSLFLAFVFDNFRIWMHSLEVLIVFPTKTMEFLMIKLNYAPTTSLNYKIMYPKISILNLKPQNMDYIKTRRI